jgi:hypothetical protein
LDILKLDIAQIYGSAFQVFWSNPAKHSNRYAQTVLVCSSTTLLS